MDLKSIDLMEILARALRAEQGDCIECGHAGDDTVPQCVECGHEAVDPDTHVCAVCREAVATVQVCAKCHSPKPTVEDLRAEAATIQVARTRRAFGDGSVTWNALLNAEMDLSIARARLEQPSALVHA